MRYLITLILLFSLISCSNEKKEKELLNQISELEQKLDECQNGAEKLSARMKLSFEKQDYESCKSIFKEMENRHPESELFSGVKDIYQKVLSIENKREEEKQRELERKRKEKLRSLNKLKKEYDDVSGITWYYQPYFIHYNNTNLTSIYIGDNGSRQWLRLKMSYKGDSWIFFERSYLSYDGITKEIPFDKYDDKKTENDTDVWEWIDVSVTNDVENFLRDFAKSKNAKMRLSGKYTRTRNLTWNERQGIIDVLNGYDALRELK